MTVIQSGICNVLYISYFCHVWIFIKIMVHLVQNTEGIETYLKGVFKNS